MDRIAFIIGDTFLYWNSIILTLAAAVAICLFLAFYLSRSKTSTPAAVAIPMAMVLSVVFARLAHWYFQPDSYSGFLGAMTNYTTGGYALLGAFAGCALTAGLLKLIRLESNLPHMFDAMCLGGCAGIAVGRLACLFSAADRGQLLESVKSLPFAYPVANAVTGALEYRLATFMIQAMAVGLVFVILTLFFCVGHPKSGDTTLLFFLLYGMSQAVLDSTRYDSLYMRSNGFIGVAQLLGAISIVVVSVLLSIRLVKARGFKAWFIPIWVAIPALMGGAGYMEYYIQRHGDLGLFCYSIMTVCLTGILILGMVSYMLSLPAPDAE